MDLGRFGWHPEPATDFLVEVDYIAQLVLEKSIGYPDSQDGKPIQSEIESRIFKAMGFNVGGDEACVVAKEKLRNLEAEVTGIPRKLVW